MILKTSLQVGLLAVLSLLANDIFVSCTAILNRPPQAVIEVNSLTGDALLFTFRFDGSASYDPDGEIVSYKWDFGDGTTREGVKVSHQYLNYGFHLVTLTVEDEWGAEDKAYITIEVTNPPPEAEIRLETGGERKIYRGRTVWLDGSCSIDPAKIKDRVEGQKILLCPKKGFGQIISYNWEIWKAEDFWPEARLTGVVVEYTFAQLGLYKISLTVTDKGGKADTAIKRVRVYNQLPVPIISWRAVDWQKCQEVIVIEGEENPVKNAPDRIVPQACLEFNASESYDPDGWITSFQWRFADGSIKESVLVYHLVKQGEQVRLTVKDNDGAKATESIIID